MAFLPRMSPFYALTDVDGLTFGEARRALPRTGNDVAPDRFAGFIELHIEQGPVLDAAGEAVGVVTDIVGARQVTVRLTGEQNHAGTTPMARRRDAVAGFAALHARLAEAFAPVLGPDTVWTIGEVGVTPNAASIVPGEIRFSLQWRDASEDRLADMDEIAREAVAAIAATRNLGAEVAADWALRPTAMDPGLVAHCAAAAGATVPGGWRRMTSGALHDARNVAAVLPAGMLFAPSKRGISHSFYEDTDEADLVTGLRTLADAVLRASA